MVNYYINKNIKIKIDGKELVNIKTKSQTLILIENKEFGKILLLGPDKKHLIVQLSTKDEAYYHETVVHPVMAIHHNPKEVLIIGGGDGGVAREVLKHNCNVTMVEIDKKVIDFSKEHLKIDDGALDKVKIIIEDGKKHIRDTDKKYDIIILDLSDPEEISKMLFTKEFFEKIKQSLNQKGLMSIQTSSPSFEPHVLGRVYTALRQVFPMVIAYSNFVPSFFVEESYCIAGAKHDLNISKTIKKRKINLSVFEPEQLEKMIKIQSPKVTKTLSKKWKPSTDKNPVLMVK